MNSDVFVYDAVRTPFGKYGGALAGSRPDDLATGKRQEHLVNRVTICASAAEAIAGIPDGATVLVGGFGSAGQPVALIEALLEGGATGLTVVSNNAGNGDRGLAALICQRRVRKVVCSFPRQSDSWHFDAEFRADHGRRRGHHDRPGGPDRPGRRAGPGERRDAVRVRRPRRTRRTRPRAVRRNTVSMLTGLDADTLARVVAADIPPGSFVNLGIGLPTRISNYLPPDSGVMLHTENGMLGMGPEADPGQIDFDLVNAGKVPVTELPGASYFDHADSFAIMRGGHLDVWPASPASTPTWRSFSSSPAGSWYATCSASTSARSPLSSTSRSSTR